LPTAAKHRCGGSRCSGRAAGDFSQRLPCPMKGWRGPADGGEFLRIRCCQPGGFA
jgi:hypothetical protein